MDAFGDPVNCYPLFDKRDHYSFGGHVWERHRLCPSDKRVNDRKQIEGDAVAHECLIAAEKIK